jgi:hypothetical protein
MKFERSKAERWEGVAGAGSGLRCGSRWRRVLNSGGSVNLSAKPFWPEKGASSKLINPPLRVTGVMGIS